MMVSASSSEPAIVVDGVFFQLNNTGIARVWSEILARWQHMEIGPRLVVLDRGGSLPAFKKLQTMPCSTFSYDDWEGDHGRMQDICDSMNAGLFVSTYYTRAEHTPSVLLTYDMVPERLGFNLGDAPWRQKHDAIRHASALGAISRNTMSDLWEFFPETRNKPNCVALPGVSAGFFPPTPEEKKAFHDGFIVPHLAGRPFLLFVSDHWPYKNADLLYRTLESMPGNFLNTFALLLTNPLKNMPPFEKLLGLKVHSARLSENDLRLAYGSAFALVYPSLYEGFGLPALEAMACGCPVICTDKASLPEVVGDAALITDPKDRRQLRRHFINLSDDTLRQELSIKGLERARLFSWDRMAAELAEFVRNNGALAAKASWS